MAEILVKAVSSAALADLTKDQRGSYKRGMPVVVMPDGHPWGTMERLPNFVVIKFPLIPVDRLRKFIEPEMMTDVNGERITVRRRIFRIQWADLPLAARTKLQTTGELIIKARAEYTGPYDYTWTQVRQYWLNQTTGLPEAGEI